MNIGFRPIRAITNRPTKSPFTYVSGLLVLIILLAGCGRSELPTPTAVVQKSTSTATTATATSTVTPTDTPSPTVTPTSTNTPTPTITPTPTPHPMLGYTIDGLRQRDYPGGAIQIRSVLTATDTFTRYYIDYPSDDLTITGIMQLPPGEGPFPVIILNHGYIPPSRYWSGADTWQAAEGLNAAGYATISPDFRGWGRSDEGDNFFRTGLVIDALNLVSSLPSIPEIDAEQVGMWGHSMGGGVTSKAITIDPRLKAAVLYAPVSGYDIEVFARWGAGVGRDLDETLIRAYADALLRPEFLELTSPNYHFDYVTAPVQIHIGTADTSTPPEWAEEIHQRLQKAEKEVEFYSYPGQGHAFQGESWDLFMGRITEFFDRHLKDST